MPSLRHTLALALLSTALATGPVAAQDPPVAAPPVVEPPPLPERVQSGEPLEPEVRIIQREREVVEEYRIHGRLYMIKVVPRGGPPYYLVDGDGDGNLESRFHELAPGMLVPSWVLFSW
jgi:hypothetical protein